MSEQREPEPGELHEPASAKVLCNSGNARNRHANYLNNEGVDAAIEVVRGDLYHCAAAVVDSLDRLAETMRWCTLCVVCLLGVLLTLLIVATGRIG